MKTLTVFFFPESAQILGMVALEFECALSMTPSLLPCRLREQISLKCWYLSTRLYDVISEGHSLCQVSKSTVTCLPLVTRKFG
jgi:hypothetical protein